jgi:hypothetical protein
MAAIESVVQSSPAAAGWRQRLGGRAQLVVALILLLVVAAVGANRYFAGQYSPAGTVREYLSALQAGDSARAWSLMEVASPASQPNAALLNQKALAAALASTKPTYPGLTILSTTSNGPTATVDVSYVRGSATRQAHIALVQTTGRSLLIYPVWKVVVTPALLSVTLPAGSGGDSVDGQSVSLEAGKAQTIAVFPLAHRVQLLGSSMLRGTTQSVDASSLTAVPVPASATLTSGGTDAANKAIAAALTTCAAKSELQPADCPQSSTASLVEQVHWQLVGDPTSDLVVAFGADGSATGTGHYQMILSDHPSYGSGVEHQAVGGAFKAILHVTSTGVDVGQIQSAQGVPAVTRPAGATDQAAKNLVAAAIAACAAATTTSVNDCPQVTTLAVADPTNVRWTLNGDPVSGATVAFDGDHSILSVTGDFAMAVSLTMRGSQFQGNSATKRFRADLLWDGSKLLLVSVTGLLG